MGMKLPTLEYRITRTFKWPWFGTISLLGATLVIFLLACINSKPDPRNDTHLLYNFASSTLDWLRNGRHLPK